MNRPLPFDPIARAAQLWEARIGPSGTMAAVTGVMRVQQIIQSAVDGALKPHGLTFARYEALVLLTFARSASLPMRVMGERLQLHPTSVTNIVDRLERDGLVKRVPHPTDRRTTLVEITEEGRRRREAATEAVTAIDFGLNGLTERQTEQLTDLLTKVRRAAGDFIDSRTTCAAAETEMRSRSSLSALIRMGCQNRAVAPYFPRVCPNGGVLSRRHSHALGQHVRQHA